MKARSELMPPMKRSGGRVVDTRRRFEIASPASHMPGLRPTRGSVPLDVAADGVAVVVTGAWAHAPIDASAATASMRRAKARCEGFMACARDVIEWSGKWSVVRAFRAAVSARHRRV